MNEDAAELGLFSALGAAGEQIDEIRPLASRLITYTFIFRQRDDVVPDKFCGLC